MSNFSPKHCPVATAASPQGGKHWGKWSSQDIACDKDNIATVTAATPRISYVRLVRSLYWPNKRQKPTFHAKERAWWIIIIRNNLRRFYCFYVN